MSSLHELVSTIPWWAPTAMGLILLTLTVIQVWALVEPPALWRVLLNNVIAWGAIGSGYLIWQDEIEEVRERQVTS